MYKGPTHLGLPPVELHDRDSVAAIKGHACLGEHLPYLLCSFSNCGLIELKNPALGPQQDADDPA